MKFSVFLENQQLINTFVYLYQADQYKKEAKKKSDQKEVKMDEKSI